MADDGTIVSEVVIYPPPVPTGQVPMPAGSSDGGQEAQYDDPKYMSPTDPPDPTKMRDLLCYAKSRIQYLQNQQNHPNAEYVGLAYRSQGYYGSTDFFYAGQTGGDFGPALNWLSDNGISNQNIVGEIHNHTNINQDSNLVNRMPSPLDAQQAQAFADQNGLPGMLLGIIAPNGTARIYTLAQAWQYANMTND